jgi:hypothetical protein
MEFRRRWQSLLMDEQDRMRLYHASCYSFPVRLSCAPPRLKAMNASHSAGTVRILASFVVRLGVAVRARCLLTFFPIGMPWLRRSLLLFRPRHASILLRSGTATFRASAWTSAEARIHAYRATTFVRCRRSPHLLSPDPASTWNRVYELVPLPNV